jgi:DNA-binding protein HU-beta
MNKTQLIKTLAKKTNMTQVDSEKLLNAFTDVVGDALASNDQVMIADFGVFSLRKSAPRNGRNPQTGDIIQIDAKRRAGFKAYKKLNEKLQ